MFVSVEQEAPIMALVTLQRHCARLIRSGADMALKERCPLKVVHVAQAVNAAARAEGDTVSAQVLDYLYALANEAGAEMCVLTSDVTVNAIAEYALQNGVRQIVMGNGENAHGLAETLSGLLPGVEILILEEE